MTTIFSRIIAGEIPGTFVHRDETYSLRLVYNHMIAEYARHLGHADLLRQVVDGRTGG